MPPVNLYCWLRQGHLQLVNSIRLRANGLSGPMSKNSIASTNSATDRSLRNPANAGATNIPLAKATSRLTHPEDQSHDLPHLDRLDALT
jgi:hypothetical protein